MRSKFHWTAKICTAKLTNWTLKHFCCWIPSGYFKKKKLTNYFSKTKKRKNRVKTNTSFKQVQHIIGMTLMHETIEQTSRMPSVPLHKYCLRVLQEQQFFCFYIWIWKRDKNVLKKNVESEARKHIFDNVTITQTTLRCELITQQKMIEWKNA